MSTTPEPDTSKATAYRTVELRWGLVSVAAFVLGLGVFSVGFFDLLSLPVEWLEPLLPMAVMGIVSAVGLVIGGIGWRGSNDSVARLGLVLNATVVACLVLVVALVLIARTWG